MRRVLATLSLIGILVAMTAPASADTVTDAQAKRDAAARKKALAASQLNVLKSSDAQIDQALRDLTSQVSLQQAQVDAAKRRADAAQAEYDADIAKQTQTQNDITALRKQLTQQALYAYMHPQDDAVAALAVSNDWALAARREVILEHLNGGQRNVVELLKSAEADLSDERKAAAQAAEEAKARQADAQSGLADLQDARAQQAKLKQALDGRIADINSEIDELAGEEAQLTQIIKNATKPAPTNLGGKDPGGGGPIGLAWPVSGPIVSEFGMRWGRLHAGVDIAVPMSTPIHAAQSGTVIFSGVNGGYGNVVLIDHGNGVVTVYAHQSRLGVTVGQQVTRGQVIGYVGSTGHSTGPHLHFEVRINGTPQNPRKYLP